jgi:hypothetical protein
MTTYPNIIENEDGWSKWIQPRPSNYRFACCDCCLVHDMQFRIYEGRIQFRVSRNNRSTAAMRRTRKEK